MPQNSKEQIAHSTMNEKKKVFFAVVLLVLLGIPATPPSTNNF